ncbi:MAG: uroporphyrinogen-III C-methyltransferase [Deltaproteobacteria bacterium]|nr:uroporphyrinogen-III C-methyltransferase [Deltaproteobacteria bacterium]
MSAFPITLVGREVNAVVVGAGRVAERRVRALLEAGGRVTVVAPSFCDALEREADAGRIAAVREPFRPGHLAGATIVLVATSDAAVNRAAAAEARRAGLPVNVADDPEASTFHVPGVVRADGLTVAVSSGGEHPGAVRAVREYLDDHRAELAVRVERGRRRPDREARPGTVYLVGAGPGDPDLLTVRALGVLRTADVVIHDGLVPEPVLALAHRAVRECHRAPPGTPGHGAAGRQRAIDASMVRHAREGRSVVRLKCGDPLLFSRGAEEASRLTAAGVPFEVVPGVTAASACAAAAGIPLTDRDRASSVTFVTGHGAGGAAPAVDWSRLPRDGTVAIYMGVGRLGECVAGLLAAGFDTATPCAIVENASRPSQRVVRGRLADLPALAREARVRSPAVVFVGQCAGGDGSWMRPGGSSTT